MFTHPGQDFQRQGRARIVKGGQNIVQHQGSRLLRRKNQIAYCQAHGQIELVGGPLGQRQGPPGQHRPRLRGQGLKIPV